jgi:hypothetical protein
VKDHVFRIIGRWGEPAHPSTQIRQRLRIGNRRFERLVESLALRLGQGIEGIHDHDLTGLSRRLVHHAQRVEEGLDTRECDSLTASS